MATLTFKGKRVLVLGLGLLGGGIATTNWLLDQGATVTVTDLKDEKVLALSIKKVEDHLRKTAKDGKAYAKAQKRLAWALGGHDKKMIDRAQIVVVNPDVSIRNPFVQYALEQKKLVRNEGTIFYDLWKKKLVGITGTRGKTTTANWTSHFIKDSVLTGNSTVKPFQAALAERAPVAVTELSSFVLEFFPYIRRSPQVAVITNLYQDHLNRHGTMKGYAQAKAEIFLHQKAGDVLILNNDDEWTGWFLEQKPKAKVKYFSLRPLPLDLEGVWYHHGVVMERVMGKEKEVLMLGEFEAAWGMHNVANLLASALAAHCAGVSWADIQKRVASVPQVSYRQEVVHKSRVLTVVNDTTATSPDGAIAALRRWGEPNCILICGGTDRDLDFRAWAAELPKYITKSNTILLAGSATQKMRAALKAKGVGIRSYETLEQCWKVAQARAAKFISATILFSPGAKSFELFANEFDRGQQFNALVRASLGK